MKNDSANVRSLPGQITDELSAILKLGAQKMLAQAVEAEVSDYID